MISMIAVLMVIIQAFGNGIGYALFKKASLRRRKDVFAQLKSLATNIWFIIGLAVYAAAALLYVTALKFEDVSALYPIAATQYVWACVFAMLIFKEKVNKYKWIGVMLIVAGAALIGLGG